MKPPPTSAPTLLTEAGAIAAVAGAAALAIVGGAFGRTAGAVRGVVSWQVCVCVCVCGCGFYVCVRCAGESGCVCLK